MLSLLDDDDFEPQMDFGRYNHLIHVWGTSVINCLIEMILRAQ